MKNDKNIVIKVADKGSAVVVWDREDYIMKAEKQLGEGRVYEELPDDPEPLIRIMHRTTEKTRKRGGELKNVLNISKLNFARFYLSPKIHK